MTTAVSRGGVLRALNKGDGPRRKLRLNLGVCLSEPYDERFPGHLAAPYFYNPLNRKRYVKDCMDWIIRKICLHVNRARYTQYFLSFPTPSPSLMLK
jgi:hypothetical protein